MNTLGGKSDLMDYIKFLRNSKNKNEIVKSNKIRMYIKLLSKYGLNLGEPYIKHIEGQIWELRPLRDRILFAVVDGSVIILLNYFMKETRKTPRREIYKANKYLNDYISRR